MAAENRVWENKWKLIHDKKQVTLVRASVNMRAGVQPLLFGVAQVYSLGCSLIWYCFGMLRCGHYDEECLLPAGRPATAFPAEFGPCCNRLCASKLQNVLQHDQCVCTPAPEKHLETSVDSKHARWNSNSGDGAQFQIEFKFLSNYVWSVLHFSSQFMVLVLTSKLAGIELYDPSSPLPHSGTDEGHSLPHLTWRKNRNRDLQVISASKQMEQNSVGHPNITDNELSSKTPTLTSGTGYECNHWETVLWAPDTVRPECHNHPHYLWQVPKVKQSNAEVAFTDQIWPPKPFKMTYLAQWYQWQWKKINKEATASCHSLVPPESWRVVQKHSSMIVSLLCLAS